MYTFRNLLFGIGVSCVIPCASSVAEEHPEPTEAIHHDDIGRRFYIDGNFGKLYTEFKLRGIVIKPTGKGDTSGMVRLEITHIRGKEAEQRRIEYILTDLHFEVGSEVELLVREEARLWYPEGIDDIISNPGTSHFHKLYCKVSLHLRKTLSPPSTAENGNPAKDKNSEPAGTNEPTTSPESDSGGNADPFRAKAPDSKE